MKESVFEIKPNKNKTKDIHFIITDNVTIHSDLNSFKEKLNETIKIAKQITISSEKPFQADITFVQLIFAIKKAAAKNSVQLKFEFEIHDETKELFDFAGLLKFIKN